MKYADADGNCSLCGQPKITGRHNCDKLREIATEIRDSKKTYTKRTTQADRMLGDDFTSRYDNVD